MRNLKTEVFPSKGTLRETLEQKMICELEPKSKEAETESNLLKKVVGIFPRAVGDIWFYKKSWKNISDWKNVPSAKVGSSVYYRYKSRKTSIRLQRIKAIKEKITAIYFEAKQR